MTKRAVVAASFFLIATTAAFAAVDPAVDRYVKRSLPVCPGSNVNLQSVGTQGPTGFETFRVQQQSSEEGCGRTGWALVSRTSNDIVFGDVLQLPKTTGPIDKRLQQFAFNLLKKNVTVTVGKTPVGSDGLRTVTITSTSRYGPFEYHGFVDAGERFLIIGRRGNIKGDAGDQLVAALNAAEAATRGNAMGRIRVLELSDFQCPTCARAHSALEPFFKKNLAKISYSRLDLPLFESHDWSFQAALAARAIQKVAPTKYWSFVDYIFTSQASLTAANVNSKIKEFTEDNDIDFTKFAALFNSQVEKKKLLAQVSRSYDNGILGTPTFIVNGQPVYYGENGAHLKNYLEKLVNAK